MVYSISNEEISNLSYEAIWIKKKRNIGNKKAIRCDKKIRKIYKNIT